MKRDLLALPLLGLALGLAGCAVTGAGAPVEPVVAAAWQAPLPHDGDVAELRRWWAQFDDPLLGRLVDAAEAASPTIASAAARIEDARARRAVAGAALLPSLDATANLARGRQDVSLPVGTSDGIGLQASWEIDVFGRNRAARDAAEARLEGAGASWHDARVIVAAETANQYLALRACESLLAQARLDAESRVETARLTELSMQSGFESRGNAALTRASAAQGSVLVKQQSEQCEQTVKALVALTGIAEPDLRAQLADAAARLPQPAAIAVPSVPAAALAQRPDVFARARDVVAASADVGSAEADQWPRITLAGSVGAARFESRLRLVQRHDVEHRSGRRQPAGVRCGRAPRQRRRRARALRRGDERLCGDAAQCDPRRRERADRLARNRRPQRRRAERRRQLRGLVPRHRGALPAAASKRCSSSRTRAAAPWPRRSP